MNKYDDVVGDMGRCSTSFLVLSKAESVIRSGVSPLCIICCVNVVSVKATAVIARSAFSHASPKPFGEGRDGFARSECLCTFFVSSAEFAQTNQLPTLGKVRSVVGRLYDQKGALSLSSGGGGASSVVIKSGDDLVLKPVSVGPQNFAMEEALEKAGVSANDISYLELHGPATVEGDVEEYSAVKSVFCNEKKPARTNVLYTGTVTATLGNVELAFGLVGVLKTLMVVSRGLVPGCMDTQKPYTFAKECDVSALPNVAMPMKTQAVMFPEKNGVVFASVHGFGVDGYAGHAVLEIDKEVKDAWQNYVELSCSDDTYIVHPPLAELKLKSPADLSAVGEFSVTFANGNRVEWMDQVDLRSVGDLARVIVVTEKSVEVFPRGVAKQKVGQGLNRPVQITLRHIQCPDGKSEEEFTESLRSKLKKQGAQLMWYKKAEESCCFRVEQF